MKNDHEERRCKSCGKLLIDEKVPFCRRCFLEGRNKVRNVAAIAGTILLTVLSAVAATKNGSDSHTN
jgi:hypothetical protein